MNVVTSNKNKEIIDKLNIDIIKRIDGEISVEELTRQLVNLYFNKLIIDSSSISNLNNDDVLKQISSSIDPNRTIIIVDSSDESKYLISTLIKNGFYNITRNFEGINYLYNNPNSYDTVKHLVINDSPKVEENIVTEQPITQFAPIMNMENQPMMNQPQMVQQPMQQPQMQQQSVQNSVASQKTIIGIQNLSLHAGATSMVNLITRQLISHGYTTYGIEMFKQDLMYYHEPYLKSCMNKQDLENELRKMEANAVVIVDLNEFGEDYKYCNEILYLLEPSFIKLTKAMKKNRNLFQDHKKDKIVLNMSFVNNQELSDFEFESKIKVFANIPPLNDRNRNLEEINDLLSKLGFTVK